VANPDKPSRPVNSPKAVYQIEPGLLAVLQTYGLPEWDSMLLTYLSTVQTLSARYAHERAEQKITVRVAEEEVLYLSPGGQNELIKHVLEVFRRYSWETEVWVAESPSHLIHFDGDRFLGPYEGEQRED
jgi:hypothetical protein